MSISNAQNSSLSDDCDDLQPPAVSWTSLDFGTVEQGGSQTLQVVISNTGNAPMLWIADTGEASWLTLNVNTGVLQSGEEQTINVTVDTSLMAVGEYAASLTFTAEADDCSASVSVQVILTVIPSIIPTPFTPPVQPPAVGVSFGSLRSGSIGILQQVISNPDSRPVNWFGDTGGAEWLILDPNSGMLQPGEIQTISLLADTRLLEGIGMHSALLTFVSQVTEPEIDSSVSTPKERELEALTTASEGSIAMSQSVQVPVIADLSGIPDRVSGPKAPAANTASLNFNAPSMSKSLVITNTDTQTVHWTVTTAYAAGGSSWLTLSSTSGNLLSTKSATLTVKASTSSLTPGNYSALLTFNSEIISSGVVMWSNPSTMVLVTLTV